MSETDQFDIVVNEHSCERRFLFDAARLLNEHLAAVGLAVGVGGPNALRVGPVEGHQTELRTLGEIAACIARLSHG